MSFSSATHPAPSPHALEARAAVLRRIKAEHRMFRSAWREFDRLSLPRDAQQADRLVQQTVARLRQHGRLEREYLYPALRASTDRMQPVERADIEHAALDGLLDRLQSLGCGDDGFAALFEVVCEHTVQHIRHEESQLLPRLEQAPVDWPAVLALLEAAEEEPAVAARSAAAEAEPSASALPEAARPVPPAATGEAVPVVHASPVPLAEPADDTLPPDAVRARPDTPAERRAARRSAPIK